MGWGGGGRGQREKDSEGPGKFTKERRNKRNVTNKNREKGGNIYTRITTIESTFFQNPLEGYGRGLSRAYLFYVAESETHI